MHIAYSTIPLLASYSAFVTAYPQDQGFTPTDFFHPLDTETNGLSSTGSPILNKGPPSCWSTPTAPPNDPKSPIQNGGTCRVCVVQNCNGQEPDNTPGYEMWVRDDQNHAIGDIQPFGMMRGDVARPSSPVSFPVGAASINVWSALPDPGDAYVVVYMVWDRPAGWSGPETMVFDTGSKEGLAGNNCSLTETDANDSKIYFSCGFNCGTI